MVCRWGVVVGLTICVAYVYAEAEWRDTMLKKENGHRSDHGVDELKMNSELNAMAQKYADKLAGICGKGHSEHQDRMYEGKVAGENIYRKTYGGKPVNFATAEEDAPHAADKWYAENAKYPWKNPNSVGKGMGVGHFTQQVWKESKEVGYGLSYGKKKGCAKIFVVANYFPRGNMKGDYANNVLPKQ